MGLQSIFWQIEKTTELLILLRMMVFAAKDNQCTNTTDSQYTIDSS